MNVKEITQKAKKRIIEMFNIKEKDLFPILVVCIIVLLNIAGSTLNLRCDMTRNNTYSLSKKSKDVVSNLKENLKIKVLFSSKDLPGQHVTLFNYLKDLLEEYDYYGNRHFSYEIVPDGELEKTASDYGITQVQTQELADDQVKIRRVYMGLVIQQADAIEKINQITDPVGLEYTITSTIEKMSSKVEGLLNLQDKIACRLYVDGTIQYLPIDGIDKLEGKVKEAVGKINASNYDKLAFELVDPSLEKKTDEIAATYGLQKLKWNAMNTRSGKAVPAGEGVLGIVLSTGKKFQTVPLNVAPTLFGNYVVSGLEKLEDTLNDAVGRLVSASPKVGYITGHGELDTANERDPNGASVLRELMEDTYTLVNIDLTKEEIPEDVSTIIVNGPKQAFKEHELYKLDQFLMKGKSAIFLLSSFQEMNMQQQGMFGQQEPIVLPVETGLEPLLASYGVTVNRDIVMDESCFRGQVEVPFAPIITRDGLSRESVITRYFQGLAFFKPSSVTLNREKLKKEKIEGTILVSSSESSWLQTGRVTFNPMAAMVNKPKELKRYDLAALVSGRLTSYFRGKEIPKNPDEKQAAAGALTAVSRFDETVKQGESRIIVVGTAEITSSSWIMNSPRILNNFFQGGQGDKFNANGLFLTNMVDFTNGHPQNPEMRTKRLEYAPIKKLGDAERVIYKTFNLGGVPLLVILAGLFIWKRRGQRRKNVMEQFSAEAVK